jgi:hypothetical protein
MAALCLGLAGCASTTVNKTGPGAQERWCDTSLRAIVQWDTEWRPDQKDVAAREAAAGRAIERFFAGSRCFARTVVRREGRVDPNYPRVVFITVRELGPVVRIGPALFEGGTEVILDIRIPNTTADFRIHWKDGGHLVLKGVGTLEEDMTAALEAALNDKR